MRWVNGIKLPWSYAMWGANPHLCKSLKEHFRYETRPSGICGLSVKARYSLGDK